MQKINSSVYIGKDNTGVSKGNVTLKNAVNEAIKSAIASGKMDEFVATANEQASGEIFEGLLDN